MKYYHHLIDIHREEIYPAEITIENGKITSISETDIPCKNFILPGLIDAHIHIESSMLLPSSFARAAVKHGTIATVSDPHEIANVCGMEGVQYMINNSKKVPFHFFFGAPSCVPATRFETAGATIDSDGIKSLLDNPDIFYLSEMMNYPGVLDEDKEVLKKIEYARIAGKPVDGHAPGLQGEKAIKYIQAGISTDHECYTYEEALHKVKHGMKILIREGSAAKNFEALIPLLHDFENDIMFCSDDKHPDELLLHHINDHVKRALEKDIHLFKVLKAACINPVLHYKLPVGLLRQNDPADFIVIDDPYSFNILKTYIQGNCVFENGESNIPHIEEKSINQFENITIFPNDLKIRANDHENIQVIEVMDGQLITKKMMAKAKIREGEIIQDIKNDVLKIAVMNRYQNQKPSVAFIRNFGIKKGAIAGTVAHDSHNIICVGADDESMLKAIRAIAETRGGICVYEEGHCDTLPLPVAGLMSLNTAEETGRAYQRLDQKAKELGSTLKAPFMTLSFMALLVIPNLKLSDKGLFDGEQFTFTPVAV